MNEYLYVIPPMAVTDATLTFASMAEDDATAAWDVDATYDAGDRCHSALAHTVYEARTTTSGADPADAANVYDPDANPAGVWIEVGATNRWRAFDSRMSDPCADDADLVWSITPTSMVTAVALFGLSAASVRVMVTGEPISDWTVIEDGTLIGDGGTVIYDEEISLIDNSAVVDWRSYFYAPMVYRSEVVFQNVLGYAGSGLVIEVKAPSGTRRVGEVVVGLEKRIGRMGLGPQIGITDYSRKERDTFGNPVIVERAFADRTTYPLMLAPLEVREAKRTLASLRAQPAVYHGGEGSDAYGLMTYGFFRDIPFTLDSPGAAFLNLEVEGLT